MSTFLLLVRNSGSNRLSPEEKQAIYAKYGKWVEKLDAGDHLVHAGKLRVNSGKVIRGTNHVVSDGPYCEAKR